MSKTLKQTFMITNYSWNSNNKILILITLIIPFLLSLGFWQLDRADEKKLLQKNYQLKTQLKARSIDELSVSEDLSYTPVVIEGFFDNSRIFFLDNRIVNGKVGYEVILPLTTNQGMTVLVNRGWVLGPRKRDELPKIRNITSKVNLKGNVHVPLGKPVLLDTDKWSNTWPVVVQWVDIKRIENMIGAQVFPHIVRLKPDSDWSLMVNWAPINTSPQKHLGYAFQWFLMALALVIFWVYSSFERTGVKELDNG